jgi:hypothetical protein
MRRRVSFVRACVCIPDGSDLRPFMTILGKLVSCGETVSEDVNGGGVDWRTEVGD